MGDGIRALAFWVFLWDKSSSLWSLLQFILLTKGYAVYFEPFHNLHPITPKQQDLKDSKMQTELEQRHFVIHLRITMVTKSAKINFHILTPYSVLPFQSLWKHCIFNVSCHFELPEHFACWVELLAVGGTLCYFLY